MTLWDAEFYAVGMYFRCELDLSDLEDLENTAFLVDFSEFNSETVVVMKFPLPIWAFTSYQTLSSRRF